jgi:hypothetical protein
MIWRFWKRKKKPFTEEQEIIIETIAERVAWDIVNKEKDPDTEEDAR